jgi:hypothetical protein
MIITSKKNKKLTEAFYAPVMVDVNNIEERR